MNTLFEIRIDPASKGSREASRTLHRQLRAAILDGRLAGGAKLPATRDSEAFFGVSRNTAAEVYDRLVQDGLLVTRRGSGTFVANAIPQPTRRDRRASDILDPRLNAFWTSREVSSAMGFWQDDPIEVGAPNVPQIDFRPALVDSQLFPFDVFRRMLAKQLRKLERKPARYQSAYGNQGNRRLRDAISKHIALTRAVACDADDVIVTSGAQQAFDLIARVLVKPDETVVAVEDPGYPPMRVAFAAAGAKLVPVEVDGEGLIVERIPENVGIICVCSSHQFPLGMTMSPRRRKDLVELARKRGAVIVEDDYDGEFRFDGSPLEALRAHAAGDLVFYVGTFSKCMLPALRMGFIVAPEWATSTLVSAKNGLDWHCASPLQLGVAAFIEEGHLSHHVRKMRQIYQKRRQVLLKRLEDDLAEWLEPVPSWYGMHVAAVARKSVDVNRVCASLRRADVRMHGLDRYYLGKKTKDGFVFGYGTVDPREIHRGLDALREALSA